MTAQRSNASVYLSDPHMPVEEAIKQTQVIVIGAHHDDVPIMYPHAGIEKRPFMAIIATDGAGSPNEKGDYTLSKGFKPEHIARLRSLEQNAEAAAGKYPIQFQLGHTSDDIGGHGDGTGPGQKALTDEIYHILSRAPNLGEVYVHNPFDKHQTHNAVTRATIEAIRMLEPARRNDIKLIGREVWRGLDWVVEGKNTPLDKAPVSEEAVKAMKRGLSQHLTQTSIKSYVEAVEGRYRNNATFRDSHHADDAKAAVLGIDMTDLIKENPVTMEQFTQRYVDKFHDELISRAKMFEPQAHDLPNTPFTPPPEVRGDELVDMVLPKAIHAINKNLDWLGDTGFDLYRKFVKNVVDTHSKSNRPVVQTSYQPAYGALMDALTPQTPDESAQRIMDRLTTHILQNLKTVQGPAR